MPRAWSVLVTLALVACPAEKNTTMDDVTTETTATTSTATSDAPTTTGTGVLASCPEHDQTDACCCFEEIPGPYDVAPAGTMSACGLSPLCPSMTFTCPQQDGLHEDLNCADMATEDEAALECALQALVDGKRGQLRWVIWSYGNVSANIVELDLVGDGTLFRQGHYRFSDCYDTHAVQRLSLPAPAYYKGCLAETGWRARFDCLRAAPFDEPLETCIPGSAYTSEHC